MTVLSLVQEKIKRGKLKPSQMDGYYCLKCDSSTFKLYAHGSIHCATCGARMSNLVVVMEQAPA